MSPRETRLRFRFLTLCFDRNAGTCQYNRRVPFAEGLSFLCCMCIELFPQETHRQRRTAGAALESFPCRWSRRVIFPIRAEERASVRLTAGETDGSGIHLRTGETLAAMTSRPPFEREREMSDGRVHRARAPVIDSRSWRFDNRMTEVKRDSLRERLEEL